MACCFLCLKCVFLHGALRHTIPSSNCIIALFAGTYSWWLAASLYPRRGCGGSGKAGMTIFGMLSCGYAQEVDLGSLGCTNFLDVPTLWKRLPFWLSIYSMVILLAPFYWFAPSWRTATGTAVRISLHRLQLLNYFRTFWRSYSLDGSDCGTLGLRLLGRVGLVLDGRALLVTLFLPGLPTLCGGTHYFVINI